MGLPFVPQAWFHSGLLLLTLMLITACGTQMEKNQSPETQPRTPMQEIQLLLGLLFMLMLVALWGITMTMYKSPKELTKESTTNVEGNVGTKDDKQPEGNATHDSTPVSPSSLDSGIKSMCHKQDEDCAEKTGMSSREQQFPIIYKKSDPYRCERWLDSSQRLFIRYLKVTLHKLPSCPCSYPEEALSGVATLFDQRLNNTFSWANAIDADKYVLAYHPSASVCLRSLNGKNINILGAQLCCYDCCHRLLTRGKGAGSPEFISPYVSPNLHFTLSHYPWVICKGNWSRFHSMLPPDNGLSCTERPSKNTYEAQLLELSGN